MTGSNDDAAAEQGILTVFWLYKVFKDAGTSPPSISVSYFNLK